MLVSEQLIDKLENLESDLSVLKERAGHSEGGRVLSIVFTDLTKLTAFVQRCDGSIDESLEKELPFKFRCE